MTMMVGFKSVQPNYVRKQQVSFGRLDDEFKTSVQKDLKSYKENQDALKGLDLRPASLRLADQGKGVGHIINYYEGTAKSWEDNAKEIEEFLKHPEKGRKKAAELKEDAKELRKLIKPFKQFIVPDCKN